MCEYNQAMDELGAWLARQSVDFIAFLEEVYREGSKPGMVLEIRAYPKRITADEILGLKLALDRKTLHQLLDESSHS